MQNVLTDLSIIRSMCIIVQISYSYRLRSGKQLVVSNVNVLAPCLFGAEFERAIGMYTWQRV